MSFSAISFIFDSHFGKYIETNVVRNWQLLDFFHAKNTIFIFSFSKSTKKYYKNNATTISAKTVTDFDGLVEFKSLYFEQ